MPLADAVARRRDRHFRRAVFRRPAHENGRQSFSRLSGVVECRGVLSVFCCKPPPCRRQHRALLILVVLTFVPFNVMHPLRTTRLRDLNIALTGDLGDTGGASRLPPNFRGIAAVARLALCAIGVYILSAVTSLIRLTGRDAHDGIADEPGSLGRAADADGP